jgi:hypothetical protein
LFYVNENNKPEYLDGQANFMQLWLKENGSWKMKRILSYNHHAPTHGNKRKEVSLTMVQFNRLTGNFSSGKFGQVEVKITNDHLALMIGNKTFDLFPQSDTSFFTKDRDLIFDFHLDGKDKAQRIP